MAAAERKTWEASVSHELIRAKRVAARELGKMETELRSTIEALEHSAKKHPRRMALVALSLGAALGAASMHLVQPKRGRRTRH